MPNQSMGLWSSVGCDSFRDETYGDVKTSGNNVQDVSYGDETYGDVTYGDVSSLSHAECEIIALLYLTLKNLKLF